MANDIFSKYVVNEPQEGAGSRALSGFLRTTPFNPANIVEAIKHPIDTANSMMWNPLADLLKASQAGSVGEGLKTMARGVPFVGNGLVNAGERAASGDVAGALGEAGGIASGFAVPEVAGRVLSKVPAGVVRAGKFLEDAGSAARKPVSLAGMMEMAHNPVIGAGAIAAPYVAEAVGKGTQAVGRGLEGLRNRMTGKPTEVSEGGSSNARGYRRQSTEVPYRHQGELPDNTTTHGPDLSPIQQFYRDNPMGEGRLTGLGEGPRAAGPGNLYDISRLASEDVRAGKPLGPKTYEQGLPDVPDFDFEGSADYLPGESTPPPAAGGFGIEGPYDSPSLRSLRLLKNVEEPLADPGAELARRLGTPSDLDVLNKVVDRARTGSWNPR